MKRFWLAAAVALCAPSVALAGACDVHVKKASTAKGDELVTAFKDLTKCDKAQAATSFESFMKASGDADTLVSLSLVAIDAEQYTPVWAMIEKIPDYSARDEVAEKVGAACADHAKVLPFLQGAYFGLRDIQFEQWDDALVSCPSDELTKFLEGEVAKPPASSYNEKYAAIVTAYAKRKKADALPALEKAAIAAAENGPFDMILEKMATAVEPAEIGEEMSAADKKKLEDSLVKVANGVKPERAKQVADSLYNAGAEQAAASLLPRVYPDRVQGGGKLLYGVASVEVCDKEAVVHWAGVTDPAKRWSILTDVEAPARAFKPKLKCTAKDAWPVLATPEPVKDSAEIQKWVDGVVAEYAGKGMSASAKGEKDFALN
jgi:hypothetical protein